MRFLVVGLGNPGVKYEKNRHNLGFRIIDRLALRGQDLPDSCRPIFRKGTKAFATEVETDGVNLLLAKPRTYVNRSGEAVLNLLTRKRISKENLLVVCDDLSLPFGACRLRNKGSSGGHNGLQSIIEAIGDEFVRLRVGIGAPESSEEWADYVLDNFTPEEEEKLPEIIDRAAEEILNYIKMKGER